MFFCSEKLTGRKKRDLHMEEIGCKCQTFFSLSLKWQEETKYKRQSFGFPDGSVDKESACNAGDPSSIPAGEGIGYPHQYSGLENSMEGMVHGVAKSRTLSDFKC